MRTALYIIAVAAMIFGLVWRFDAGAKHDYGWGNIGSACCSFAALFLAFVAGGMPE